MKGLLQAEERCNFEFAGVVGGRVAVAVVVPGYYYVAVQGQDQGKIRRVQIPPQSHHTGAGTSTRGRLHPPSSSPGSGSGRSTGPETVQIDCQVACRPGLSYVGICADSSLAMSRSGVSAGEKRADDGREKEPLELRLRVLGNARIHRLTIQDGRVIIMAEASERR